MARLLFRILARRSFISFGLVALLVGALLASIHLTSRYALKRYVEYQLARIPWDIALYQKGPSGGDEKLRDFVRSTPGVRDVASLAFMRARFPEGGEVQARVDGTPLNTPWLSVLAASDISLLPPQLGFALSRHDGGDARGAVLALVGPEIAVGKPFLSLQGARRFVMQVTTLGKTDTVFETPIRQVVRLDRDELNRWLMDQTGSVSYVPAIGAILLMPYDWSVITRFDFVANGIVPGDLAGSFASEQIHVQQAEYAPEIVYLARIDRERLISGWNLPASLANVTALTRRLHSDAAEQGPQPNDTARDDAHHGGDEEAAEGPHPEKFGGISYVIDSTTQVLLARMQATARSIGVLSVLIALPLLWMAWVLGANLTGLLMLNERRTLGLLRLRGVTGAAIGRVLVASVGAAGAIGGAIGLAAGSIVTLAVYERGALPISVLADRAQLSASAVFLAVTVVMALLVSRRFVRYATTISPLEATRRVSTSETAHTASRIAVAPVVAFLAGTFVLASWISGVSLADRVGQPWLRTIEQLLYFLGLPLFVFGLGSILTAGGGLHRLMTPLLRGLGGRLGGFTLRHVSAKPHRTSAFLLIVALMSSVSLYPLITSGSFQEKAARGARVQIGADWQLLYNTPDLVDSAQLSGAARDQMPAVAAAVEPLLASLRAIDGVTAVTYMVEALLPNFYLPGYGLRGVPLYLLGDVSGYERHAYSEPSVGVTADFDTLLQRIRAGQVATSPSVAEFWQLAPGTSTVVGLDRARQAVAAPSAGTLAYLPGLPPKTVSDRQGYVQARIDYLNYLLGTNAYLAGAADAQGLADLQLLLPRIVVMVRTRDGLDADRLRTALTTATSVPPLEVHSLEEEVQKVGNDMYIALALANMRIYLIGGLLLALVAIVAIAMANYVEDRRTLALLRIRGASPASLWRFLLAALLAPALVGLAIGAAAAAIAGFGLANYVWQLRAVRTVVQLLPTHLVVEPITGALLVLLMAFLVIVAGGFSWWAYRHTAHSAMRGT